MLRFVLATPRLLDDPANVVIAVGRKLVADRPHLGNNRIIIHG